MIICLLVLALVAVSVLYFQQRSVLADNQRDSKANAQAAVALKAEVTRLQKVNATLEKSLDAAKAAGDGMSSEQLAQAKTVFQGMAINLERCSGAITEAAARTVEIMASDPKEAGSKVNRILGRCRDVAQDAAIAAKALDD